MTANEYATATATGREGLSRHADDPREEVGDTLRRSYWLNSSAQSTRARALLAGVAAALARCCRRLVMARELTLWLEHGARSPQGWSHRLGGSLRHTPKVTIDISACDGDVDSRQPPSPPVGGHGRALHRHRRAGAWCWLRRADVDAEGRILRLGMAADGQVRREQVEPARA